MSVDNGETEKLSIKVDRLPNPARTEYLAQLNSDNSFSFFSNGLVTQATFDAYTAYRSAREAVIFELPDLKTRLSVLKEKMVQAGMKDRIMHRIMERISARINVEDSERVRDTEQERAVDTILDYFENQRPELLKKVKNDEIKPGVRVYLPQLNMMGIVRNTVDTSPPIIVQPFVQIGTFNNIPITENLVMVEISEWFPEIVEHSSLDESTDSEEALPYDGFPTYQEYLSSLIDTPGEPQRDRIVSLKKVGQLEKVRLLLAGIYYPNASVGEYLDKGFIVNNYAFGIEKPLIQAQIEVDHEKIDFSQRGMLTTQDLDALQKLDVEELAGVASAQEVGTAMMEFLHGKIYFYRRHFKEIFESISPEEGDQHSLMNRVKDLVNTEWDKGKAFYFWKRVYDLLGTRANEINEWTTTDAYKQAEQELTEGLIKKGDPELSLKQNFMQASRGHKQLPDVVSPDLRSRHRVREINDISYEGNRLNTVCAHLAYCLGISQRGSGSSSWDQKYMTMREFYDLAMKTDVLNPLVQKA